MHGIATRYSAFTVLGEPGDQEIGDVRESEWLGQVDSKSLCSPFRHALPAPVIRTHDVAATWPVLLID